MKTYPAQARNAFTQLSVRDLMRDKCCITAYRKQFRDCFEAKRPRDDAHFKMPLKFFNNYFNLYNSYLQLLPKQESKATFTTYNN